MVAREGFPRSLPNGRSFFLGKNREVVWREGAIKSREGIDLPDMSDRAPPQREGGRTRGFSYRRTNSCL